MSILIKGMDMPRDCPVCPIAHWNKIDKLTGCDVVPGKRYAINDPEYANSDKRPDWCPLVEVPSNYSNLFWLMMEHPELPVVPMVEYDIVADDSCRWWLGQWGRAAITEYLVTDERIYFKDDDMEDVLAGVKEYRDKWEDMTEEEMRTVFDGLPWIKCIVVYIGS